MADYRGIHFIVDDKGRKKAVVTMSVNRPGGKPTTQLCLPCFRKRVDEVIAALKGGKP